MTWALWLVIGVVVVSCLRYLHTDEGNAQRDMENGL